MALINGDVRSFTENSNVEEYNITEEDLKLAPDLPNPTPEPVDLNGSAVESENVKFNETSELNDTDYQSDLTVSLDNSSEQGWILYSVPPEAGYFTTTVSKYGFFESSEITLESYETADSNNTPLDTARLKGEQDWKLESNDNFLRFVIDSNSPDADIYSLEFREEQELGTFATIGRYIGSGVNAISSWFKLLTGLPSGLLWISLVLGIVGTLIVLEVILW